MWSLCFLLFFFFKQKTAYEMRISDWSSDVCSSDLCTYCVVPYTRGAEVSRSFSAIMDEARALIDGGAREITLLGQNVNAWRGADPAGRSVGLEGLIRALDALPDLRRIRYTTSHPNDMTEDLIQAHGDVEKLMPYLHLQIGRAH